MSNEVIISKTLMGIQSDRGSSRVVRMMLLCLGGWMSLVVPCRGLTLYDFGNPIAEEQLYIELINRARADPAGEGARLAATTDPDVLSAYGYFHVSLDTMQTEFKGIAALPPLAPNASLQTSSRGHSAWMLANATQSHNETNPANDPYTRMTAAGYSYTTAGENIYASAMSVWYGHAGFEVDWGTGTGGMQDPRGHRANIHNAAFRELGVGVVLGTNGVAGPQLVTQDFGASTSNPTLATGVAYYDLNSNNQYDVGEAISGLTVNVSGADVTRYCVTAIGGGWVVPVPATAANRTVTFSGLSMNKSVSLAIPVASHAKADLKLTNVAPTITSSASGDADSLFTVTFNPVGGATSYKWNRWTSSAAAAENCESAANIITSTTGTYSVLNTNVKQQGSACFQLENATGTSQWLQLNTLYYGLTSPSLTFQSSIQYATSSELFKVEFKEEDGFDWQDAFSQTGTNGPGESTFNLRTALLTGMTGKAFRVRFLLNFSNGSYYNISGDNFGWLIDAITFSGVAALNNNTCVTLTGTSGSFTPAAGSYLMSVTPVISSRDFPASYQTITAAVGPPTLPSFVTQPVSVAIVSGTATFIVAASGTSPTFQWYAGSSGVTTSPVSGATGNSFTTPALSSTTSYWVRASNAVGSADSITATAWVMIPPGITTQPVSITINSGGTTTLTVVASGTTPTFQWYGGPSGDTTNPISGATGSSFTTSALTTTTSYWVRASNAVGSADSTVATATVITPLAITTQPVSISIKRNTNTTLTVVATGSVPLTYQWYKGNSPVTTSPVSGATAASYTVPGSTQGASYWVSVTNSVGTANSNTAVITIVTSITNPSITTQPVSVSINSGGSTTLTVAASGTAPTFQWYEGTTGVTTKPMAGATGTSFITPSLTSTTSYWARATNGGGTADSNSATVTVIAKATATVTLGSLAATYNGSAKSAAATTSPVGLTVSFTYNGLTTVPTSANTYAVVATINDSNYQGTASGSLVIGKATATVTLGSLAATYNGSAKSATATTSPVGLTVSFTYNGSSTAPTSANTYAVVATINDSNYQGTASGSLVISAATPTFGTWAVNLETSNGIAAGTISNQPNGDYDHDGRSNLIEYAYGSSPIVANDPAPRMPVAQLTTTQYILQYQRDTTLTDLTFTPQACSTLGNWKAPGETGTPSGFTDILISTSGGVQTRQAIVPRSSGNCFMRVRVTQQ